jgi:hypothetical protein
LLDLVSPRLTLVRSPVNRANPGDRVIRESLVVPKPLILSDLETI